MLSIFVCVTFIVVLSSAAPLSRVDCAKDDKSLLKPKLSSCFVRLVHLRLPIERRRGDPAILDRHRSANKHDAPRYPNKTYTSKKDQIMNKISANEMTGSEASEGWGLEFEKATTPEEKQSALFDMLSSGTMTSDRSEIPGRLGDLFLLVAKRGLALHKAGATAHLHLLRKYAVAATTTLDKLGMVDQSCLQLAKAIKESSGAKQVSLLLDLLSRKVKTASGEHPLYTFALCTWALEVWCTEAAGTAEITAPERFLLDNTRALGELARQAHEGCGSLDNLLSEAFDNTVFVAPEGK